MADLNRQVVRGRSWHTIAAGVVLPVNSQELAEQISQCKELTRAFRFVFK
jgi:hypothetical protein